MIRLFLCAALISCCSLIHADMADFDDLTPQSFSVGDSFSSGDLSFDVVAFGGGTSLFINQSFNFGSGNYLFAGFQVGVDVVVPNNVTGGSMLARSGNLATLALNGQSTSFFNFSQLNGFTLGGVQISVSGDQVTFDGAINSMSIGGTEVSVDDLDLNVVPEPASGILGGLIVLGLVSRRRR